MLYREKWKAHGKRKTTRKNVCFGWDIPRKITTMVAGEMNVISDVEMWHKRIGHISMQTLKNMLRKDAVAGLPKLKDCEMGKKCEVCQYGKQNRLSCLSLMKDM